jgi:hypothetical protein
MTTLNLWLGSNLIATLWFRRHAPTVGDSNKRPPLGNLWVALGGCERCDVLK